MQVYLDHHATTPLDPKVLEAMMPYLTHDFGNAASTSHGWGARAADAVAHAREQIASLISAHPLEVIFTSGATESVNLALKGLADQYGTQRNHIITWVTEHPAVLDCCEQLVQRGFRVSQLGLLPDGQLDISALDEVLGPDTLVVSLMFANNEVGTVYPVAEVGAKARTVGAFFHCDASQALGRVPIDVDAQNIDLLSMSSHKLYGPKGVGALYVRRKKPRVRLQAQQHGGGHERGLRSGTQNVPGIVGFGEACALAAAQMEEEQARLRDLRQRLLDQISHLQPVVAGGMESRLAGNLNLRFPGVRASDLLASMPQIALSTSSACSQVARTPSRTLQALGFNSDEIAGHIRIGLGRFNTASEIDHVAQLFMDEVQKCRTEIPSNTVCEL